MRRRSVVVTVLAVLAAVPASASAKTYSAYAGNPGKVPKSTDQQTVLNRFFPAKLKVRAGDRVRYSALTAHTVSVLAKGAPRPGTALPAGDTYQGILDPSGSPFFFNGQPRFINNVQVFQPQGSTTVGDGQMHSSGFLVKGKYTLKFAKKGSYKVLCLIHPGMQQTVKVLARHARGADRPSKVVAKVAKEAAKGYADARKAAAADVQPGVVDVGRERRNATILSYFPQNLTVATGTTIDFKMASPSEVHNLVFAGTGGFAQAFSAATDKLPIFGSTQNQVSPASVYGSEPASGGTYTYSGANHGIGFLWTPVMDQDDASPLPGDERITFTRPGTYQYYCAVHGSAMHGTVSVQ